MRDLTPATRGATAAPADPLTVLRAVVMCELAIYGRITAETAMQLAEAVATDEAAALIEQIRQSTREVQS